MCVGTGAYAVSGCCNAFEYWRLCLQYISCDRIGAICICLWASLPELPVHPRYSPHQISLFVYYTIYHYHISFTMKYHFFSRCVICISIPIVVPPCPDYMSPGQKLADIPKLEVTIVIVDDAGMTIRHIS